MNNSCAVSLRCGRVLSAILLLLTICPVTRASAETSKLQGVFEAVDKVPPKSPLGDDPSGGRLGGGTGSVLSGSWSEGVKAPRPDGWQGVGGKPRAVGVGVRGVHNLPEVSAPAQSDAPSPQGSIADAFPAFSGGGLGNPVGGAGGATGVFGGIGGGLLGGLGGGLGGGLFGGGLNPGMMGQFGALAGLLGQLGQGGQGAPFGGLNPSMIMQLGILSGMMRPQLGQ